MAFDISYKLDRFSGKKGHDYQSSIINISFRLQNLFWFLIEIQQIKRNKANMKKMRMLDLTPFSYDQSENDAKKNRREVWSRSEIETIFLFYNEKGSQWRLMAQQLPHRSPNSIKNRFYTFLRNVLKGLFSQHPLIETKLPHQIPSKSIRKLYEAIEEFSQFKGFLRTIIQHCSYQLSPSSIRDLTQNYAPQIYQIFLIIFKEKERPEREGSRNAQSQNQQIRKIQQPIQNCSIMGMQFQQYVTNQGIILLPKIYCWPGSHPNIPEQ